MGSGRQQGAVHIGNCGATGVDLVANKLVIKEGSDCRGERGVCCLFNKRQWWRSWYCDEGSFWILTPGWASVAEEELRRRFHVPGFWRQGCYYCILYTRRKESFLKKILSSANYLQYKAVFSTQTLPGWITSIVNSAKSIHIVYEAPLFYILSPKYSQLTSVHTCCYFWKFSYY